MVNLGAIGVELGAKLDKKEFLAFDKAAKQAEKRANKPISQKLGAAFTAKPFTDYNKSIDKSVEATGRYRDANGRLREANGKFASSQKDVVKGNRNVARSFGGLRAGALGSVGGFFAATTAIKTMYSEARENQKVSGETERIIKTMGNSAHISAGQVGELATSISNKTGIDDEAIQANSNLLLSFSNIRNEVGKNNDIFNRATITATNMSTVFKQDLKASAIQLGKALQDPVKGASALSRVGALNKSDVEKLKTMEKAGASRIDLQKYILDALDKQTKGAAAKAANPVEKLRAIMMNLAETVGTKMLPVIDKGAKVVGAFIAQMSSGKGEGGKLADSLSKIGTSLKPVLPVLAAFGKNTIGLLKEIAPIIGMLASAFNSLPGPVKSALLSFGLFFGIMAKFGVAVTVFKNVFMAAKTFFMFMRAAPLMMGPIGLAIAAVAAAAYLIITHWKDVKKFLAAAWHWIAGAAKTAFGLVKKAASVGLLGPVGLIITHWKQVKNILSKVWGWIKQAPGAVFGAVKKAISYGLLGPVGIIITRWKQIKSILGGVWNWIKNTTKSVFNSVYDNVVGPILGIPGKVVSILKKVVNGIIGVFNGAINAFNSATPGAIKIAGETVVPAIPDLPTIAKLARGAILNGPQLVVAGEDGREAFIPMSPKHRGTGVPLLAQAAKEMGFGLLAMAKGGIVGGRSRVKGYQDAETRTQNAIETKNSAFSISGGVIDSREQSILNNLTKNLQGLQKKEKLSIAQLLVDYTQNINTTQSQISSLGPPPQGKAREAWSRKLEKLQARRDSLKQQRADYKSRYNDLGQTILNTKNDIASNDRNTFLSGFGTSPQDAVLADLQTQLDYAAAFTPNNKADDNAILQQMMPLATQQVDYLKGKYEEAKKTGDKDAIDAARSAFSGAISQYTSITEALKPQGGSITDQLSSYNKTKYDLLTGHGANYFDNQSATSKLLAGQQGPNSVTIINNNREPSKNPTLFVQEVARQARKR